MLLACVAGSPLALLGGRDGQQPNLWPAALLQIPEFRMTLEKVGVDHHGETSRRSVPLPPEQPVPQIAAEVGLMGEIEDQYMFTLCLRWPHHVIGIREQAVIL